VLKEIAARYIDEIEQTMRDVVAGLPDEPEYGVMLRYAMGWSDEHDAPYNRPTGKRLRPILLLISNEAAGGNWHQALPAAAAVELLHNFSLIHDDIQDNSATRHNRPTVWKTWGMPNAINAGDAMFILAYEALSQLTEQSIALETTHYIWRIFNRTNLELTRGQHLDMRFEQLDDISVESYISMISGKSAALIAACAEIGAYIATNDRDLADKYAQFGKNIGIAFQIHDDILGIWGDPTITGKSAATDIVSRKKSLPVLFGLSQNDDLKAIYGKSTLSNNDVERAVQILDELNTLDYVRDQEALYYQKGIDSLNAAMPTGEAAKLLEQFVEFLLQRNY
jgi:geranylgeranyl diphosphate synthase type I